MDLRFGPCLPEVSRKVTGGSIAHDSLTWLQRHPEPIISLHEDNSGDYTIAYIYPPGEGVRACTQRANKSRRQLRSAV